MWMKKGGREGEILIWYKEMKGEEMKKKEGI